MNQGQYFGPYVILGRIGVGGMGAVYAGWDGRSKDLVAIKTLLMDGLQGQQENILRFQREAGLYSRLSHPNIVSFVEHNEANGMQYISLELVRGRSLAEILKSSGIAELTFSRVINIMRDLAGALEHIHNLGIIHRDIKPSNIILTQDDRVKLIDFGIASAHDGLDVTETGVVVGTVAYSSPEQNSGHDCDERSDLYSLGCVFHELLTGHRALPGSTVAEVTQFQALPSLAAPSNFNPKVPKELDHIVGRLLKPRKQDRYNSATELAEELQALKDSSAAAQGAAQGAEALVSNFEERWEAAKYAFFAGSIERAMGLATQCRDASPNDARIHFLMGKLYAVQNLPFNATESFGYAIEMAPDNNDYRLDFALALLRLDMYHQSKEQLEILVQQDKGNVVGKGLLAIAAEGHRQEVAAERAQAEGPPQPAAPLPPTLRAVPGGPPVHPASLGSHPGGPYPGTHPGSQPGAYGSSPGGYPGSSPGGYPGSSPGGVGGPVSTTPGAVVPPPPPSSSHRGTVAPPPRQGAQGPPQRTLSSMLSHQQRPPTQPYGKPAPPPTQPYGHPAPPPSTYGHSDPSHHPGPGCHSYEQDDKRLTPAQAQSLLPPEDDEPHGDVSTANWARFFSSLFPGLGNVYCGKSMRGIREMVVALLYLAIALSVFILTPKGVDFLRTQPELYRALEPYFAFLVRIGAESFVNKPYFSGWTETVQAIPILIFGIYWLQVRRNTYMSLLSEILSGEIVEVKPTGALLVARGTNHGVEVGMAFNVLKGMTSTRISVVSSEQVQKVRRFAPIGTGTVITADPTECLIRFRSFKGISARPNEGDKVEPRW